MFRKSHDLLIAADMVGGLKPSYRFEPTSTQAA